MQFIFVVTPVDRFPSDSMGGPRILKWVFKKYIKYTKISRKNSEKLRV
jgi:hypothetical protein